MIALLSQTIHTLFAHRLRSFLAILAIVWGIISVLVLVALGEGFYQTNTKSFALLMSDTQIIFPGQTAKEWKGRPARRVIQPSEVEARQLNKHSSIKDISVMYGKWDVNVTDNQGRSLPGNIAGVDSQFMKLRNVKLNKGSRNITSADLINHHRVVMVGWRLAEIGALHIGSTLTIKGVPFTVIAVTKKNEGGISLNDDATQAMIPSTVFTGMWKSKPNMLLISPESNITAQLLRKNILSFFSYQQHFDPNDKDAMYMLDLGKEANFFKTLLRGIQLFLGASGAMTLAVGSLGVANIMFLSVTERTREIGIRLAIGATPNHILGQFLVEGGLLVASGTAIGIALSYGIVALLNIVGMPEWLGTPDITLDAISLSLAVTVVFALLAAYFPARRASNLLPVIALSARA